MSNELKVSNERQIVQANIISIKDSSVNLSYRLATKEDDKKGTKDRIISIEHIHYNDTNQRLNINCADGETLIVRYNSDCIIECFEGFQRQGDPSYD